MEIELPANAWKDLRRFLSLLLVDLPQNLPRISCADWVFIGNRTDIRDVKHSPPSVRVNSEWSSDIAVLDAFPFLARRMLRHVLREWPIDLKSAPVFSSRPDVSVIIPFRGRGRLPLLEAVVRSVGTQQNTAVECIVVEQSPEQEVFSLPGDPIQLHVRGLNGDLRWNKCLAFNEGARVASGKVLILQDADIPLPANYCAEALRQLDGSQLEVCFLQRFLFYLTMRTTSQLLSSGDWSSFEVERVNQNFVGGTVAITRDAFRYIGGFDPRFTGWTGEDREFFDRSLILNGCWHGRIPFVHLWHEPAPGRVDASVRDCPEEFVEAVLKEPRELRAARLSGSFASV